MKFLLFMTYISKAMTVLCIMITPGQHTYLLYLQICYCLVIGILRKRKEIQLNMARMSENTDFKIDMIHMISNCAHHVLFKFGFWLASTYFAVT